MKAEVIEIVPEEISLEGEIIEVVEERFAIKITIADDELILVGLYDKQ